VIHEGQNNLKFKNECKICHRSFFYAADFNKHMADNHGNDLRPILPEVTVKEELVASDEDFSQTMQEQVVISRVSISYKPFKVAGNRG